jgi:hypothetical protein
MNKIIQISTVLGGWAPSEYFSQAGQFQNSLGIDPEMPKDDSGTRPSGILRPTAMSKFSGTEITGVPLWIETNNKDANAYVYANDGKVHAVIRSGDVIKMGTALNSGSALTTAAGNGLAYYNNYLYGASNADIWRYGPLNGSASLAQSFWTGLSLTALTNTAYPGINGVSIPNHPMHVHTANNRLYFGDVNANNIGILSMIKTKKVTVEGDTNDTVIPSAYNVLDFYYNWYPTCIATIGTELAIGLINGINTGIKQGNAQVAFWSTVASDTSYNRIAELPDPLITAMKNVNGQLYVFSGSAAGGMRLSRYLGGESFEELFYADDQYPPFQGAVDYMINRIVWGSKTTIPAVSASVFALGSKSRAINMGIHNILKTTSAGSSPLATAVKYLKQGAAEQPIVGWTDGSAKGLDKLSTTYGTSIWRSAIYRVGSSFRIKNIRIPLSAAVAANMTIGVKVYKDEMSTGTTVGTINSTNYANSDKFIKLYPETVGSNNFFIELTWSGTALCPVSLPITCEIEYIDD